MNKDKNKIPFIHTVALKILREEREALVDGLKGLRKNIAHLSYLQVKEPDDFEYFSWESMYGGSVSTLMKRQAQWRKELKDVELSIKVLKLDAQEHHQDMWDQQQYIKEVTSGSYNCLGGC